MHQLSGLDASFLFLETPEMPMHVGALHVFELPAGFKGRFVTVLRKHMASRLPATPALRRKLWWMPLNLANPAWVDAEPDMDEHVVEIKLKKGADLAELEGEVSRLHPELLDRKRPLWKFHVFEGLTPTSEGRKRVGMYTKLHHAAVDGQAAVALANAILDVTEVPRTLEARASGRERVFRLEMTEMLRGVIGLQAQKVADIVRKLPSTVGTLKDAAALAVTNSALVNGSEGAGNLAVAPRTPLNVSVSATRAFASVTLPLAETKALGRVHGASINDMVLMVCSTALRRYFSKKRNLPRTSLIAAVPISLREKGDTRSDNQASLSLISLGTHVADARKRLDHIKRATAAMKTTMGSVKSILPTDFPSMGVPWLMEAATALYGKAKVADRIPQFANVAISNVPGPPVPLYLAGGRMLCNYPTSIVVHGMALNITVQSYNDSLDFGLMADGAAMPDVAELAAAMHIAFDDLRLLPHPGEPEHGEAVESPVRQAGRKLAGRVTGAVAGAVKGAVGSAVKGAVKGSVTGAVKGAVGGVSGVARQVAGAALKRVTPKPKAPPKPVTAKPAPPAPRKARARTPAKAAKTG